MATQRERRVHMATQEEIRGLPGHIGHRAGAMRAHFSSIYSREMGCSLVGFSLYCICFLGGFFKASSLVELKCRLLLRMRSKERLLICLQEELANLALQAAPLRCDMVGIVMFLCFQFGLGSGGFWE